MVTPYLGELRLFGGSYAPRNWALANGQSMSIAQNAALFSLYGTTYGGDGNTSFNLPNLQGRVALSQGTGPGLTPRTIGEAGGSEQVTLSQANLPVHNHSVNATSQTATTSSPGSSVLPGVVTGHTPQLYIKPGAQALNIAPMASNSITSIGGSAPHDNMAPCLVISYIVALSGIFPTRN
jgi:microcystin-dependent protein